MKKVLHGLLLAGALLTQSSNVSAMAITNDTGTSKIIWFFPCDMIWAEFRAKVLGLTTSITKSLTEGVESQAEQYAAIAKATGNLVLAAVFTGAEEMKWRPTTIYPGRTVTLTEAGWRTYFTNFKAGTMGTGGTVRWNELKRKCSANWMGDTPETIQEVFYVVFEKSEFDQMYDAAYLGGKFKINWLTLRIGEGSLGLNENLSISAIGQ